MARLLLDSHVVKWWLDDHPMLGPATRELITESPDVVISVVTPWELGIKRVRQVELSRWIGRGDRGERLLHAEHFPGARRNCSQPGDAPLRPV